MDKPITARQFAIILWGPILLASAIWGLAVVIRGQGERAEARNAATDRALIDTEQRGRQLQQNLDVLNEQIRTTEKQSR